MVKKKKKKSRKRNSRKIDIREGESHIDSLRRRAREQGFSDVNDRYEFPRWLIYFGLFIVFLILVSIFGETSYVDECQKGFFNIGPDHCRN